MSQGIIAQRPEPDGEAIADVVRERLTTLMRRRDQPTPQELEEIVRLYRLLHAHIVYIEQRGRI